MPYIFIAQFVLHGRIMWGMFSFNPGLAKLFGLETILLYNALLLKKKVVVYAPDLQTLLDICRYSWFLLFIEQLLDDFVFVSKNRTMPLLVWHRQNWNIVYPNISLDDGEPETLKMSYVAGFTNPAIETHQELYDVLVNGMCVCV